MTTTGLIERGKLEQIAARIGLLKGRGEEATKQALVLPMLHALGFDIWNPAEVSPEFEADFLLGIRCSPRTNGRPRGSRSRPWTISTR